MKKILLSLVLVGLFIVNGLCRGFSGGGRVSVGRSYSSFSSGRSFSSYSASPHVSVIPHVSASPPVAVTHVNPIVIQQPSSNNLLLYWFLFHNNNQPQASAHMPTSQSENRINWPHVLISISGVVGIVWLIIAFA